MTGRDLILYILENNLENESVFNEEGIFVGFISEDELASNLNVGVSTVRTWSTLGALNSINVGDKLYFLKDSIDPRKLMAIQELLR